MLEVHCVRQDLKKAALLVYANKQDVRGSMTAAEISQQLGLTRIKDHTWHIQACCALTGQGSVTPVAAWSSLEIKLWLMWLIVLWWTLLYTCLTWLTCLFSPNTVEPWLAEGSLLKCHTDSQCVHDCLRNRLVMLKHRLYGDNDDNITMAECINNSLSPSQI